MRHPIGRTRNGIVVEVDLLSSPAARHIAEQPYLLGLVKEVIELSTVRGARQDIEHDMGRPVGYNFVVETTDRDSIFYVKLTQDEAFTRFVKNGQPKTTTFVTVLLRQTADKTYMLHDTWVGRLAPPPPGSEVETAASRPYWQTHAIVPGNQSLQLRTLTKVCPY